MPKSDRPRESAVPLRPPLEGVHPPLHRLVSEPMAHQPSAYMPIPAGYLDQGEEAGARADPRG